MFDKKATASLLFVCVLEIVHVGWAYGTDKWFDNLAEMGMDLNKPTRIMWAFAWKLLTPGLLSAITVLAWVNHEPMEYDGYEFPASIEAVGWIMEMLPLIIVLLYPIFPLYKAYNEGFRGKELYDELFKPTEKWYTSQMERRDAELKASESAKYIHHNLGYDDDENMQIDTNIDALQFKPDLPPPYDADEVLKF